MTGAETTFWQRAKRMKDRSDERLKTFRAQRKANIVAVVGPDYSEDSGPQARPINMQYRLYSTLIPHVVARNPQADISTYYWQYRVFAYELEKAMEWLFDEIALERYLGMLFADGLAGWGVVKIGREQNYTVPFQRGTMQARPYCAPISLDNLVVDPDCMDIREAEVVGDEYDVNQDYALAKWPQSADRIRSDIEDKEKESAKLTHKSSHETLYKKFRVIDLWFAPGNPIAGDYGAIVTVPARGPMEPLEIIDATADGPYEFLGLMDVPDNPLPLAPLTAMCALDEIINASARKFVRQTERSKTILAVEGAAEQDGSTVIKANDGEAVRVGSVDRLKEIHFGGAEPDNFTALQFLIGMADRQGGNISLLGGQGTDSKTATEAGLLGTNQQIVISELKRRLYKTVKRVVRRIGGMLLDDAGIDVTLGVGNPFVPPVRFTPEYRRMMGGDTGQYTFDIEPYSMEPEEPKKRIENIMLLTNQVLIPTMQASLAQGKMLDVPALVEIIGREMHVKELAELYHDIGVPPQMMQPGMGGPGAPALPSQGGAQVRINAGTAARGPEQMRMRERRPAQVGATT